MTQPKCLTQPKSLGGRIAAWFSPRHTLFLWGQFLNSHEDPNIRRSLLIITFISAGMAARMAAAVGWIHSDPLTRNSSPLAHAVLNSSNDFWSREVAPGLMAVALGVAAAMTLIGHLEGSQKWHVCRTAGLVLMSMCWTRIAWVALWSLGWAIAALFAACVWTSASVLVTVYNAERDARHAAVMEQVHWEQRKRDRIRETENQMRALGDMVAVMAKEPAIKEQIAAEADGSQAPAQGTKEGAAPMLRVIAG